MRATGLPTARMRAKSSGKMRDFSVTSSPAMVMGTPERNTISAASGSTRMLNSAAGVQLPWVMPPPIREMPPIFSFSSGWDRSRAATLVRGPVGTRYTGSLLSESTFAISPAAEQGRGARSGSGRSGPSRPDSPWTLGAAMGSAARGAGRPLAMGASMPSSVMTRRAL